MSWAANAFKVLVVGVGKLNLLWGGEEEEQCWVIPYFSFNTSVKYSCAGTYVYWLPQSPFVFQCWRAHFQEKMTLKYTVLRLLISNKCSDAME